MDKSVALLWPLTSNQLMDEAGLSLVEALGVEGVGEIKKLIVQVVAEFMDQGPEEGPEGDYLTALSRAHPNGHPGGSVILRGVVKTVKFSPTPRWTRCHDFNLDRVDFETGRKGGHELLADGLCSSAILTFQNFRQSFYQRGERGNSWQRDTTDFIA